MDMKASSAVPRGGTRPPGCPCKLLPMSLSSFTAAEYGDLHSLARLGPAVAQRRDGAGYTPLHLAAQQNNVATTALLLQLGCPVDGGGDDNDDVGSSTPLHRAAFSGATAAMRVLLEWSLPGSRGDDAGDGDGGGTGRCNLLARDTSFGDGSTPLHKAAAGGRYLAVHLLLEALRARRPGRVRSPGGPSPPLAPSGTTMLSLGTDAVDRAGRTPLDVARFYYAIQDAERRAVARWDEAAGGVADWGKCIELLEAAAATGDGAATTTRTTTTERVDGGAREAMGATSGTADLRPTGLLQVPRYLTGGVANCLNCNADDSAGQCLTASWVAAFHKALVDSVSQSLPASHSSAATVCRPATNQTTRNALKEMSEPVAPGKGATTVSDHSSSTLGRGASCSSCHKTKFAFYPVATGGLVCKACRLSRQRR